MNLTPQLECSPNLWHIYHILIGERDHRKNLDKEDPFKTWNSIGQSSSLSHLKWTNQISSRLFLLK